MWEAGADASSDSGDPDAAPDASGRPDSGSLDAGTDGGAARDAGPTDAAPDADPNVYPCDEAADCNPWWEGLAFCLEGFCCLGDDVDGVCMCGDRVGGCPPGFSTCCPSDDSGGRDVCMPDSSECEWGGTI